MLPVFDPWRSCTVTADAAAAGYASAQALAQRRARRLASLLRAAESGSRLYHRYLKGCNLASPDLSALPVVHKADLMRHFDDWVTNPEIHLDALRRFTADRSRIADPFLNRYVVWESSGSSGEPGIFIQDVLAMAVNDALEALRRPVVRPMQQLLDPWGLNERIAFVGAIDGHFASTVSIERLRRLNPALSGYLHSVSFLQPIAQLVAKLNAIAPTVIATYPSMAVVLAEEQQAGRLKIAPGEICTGGENLSPAMRVFIRQVFACPVVNSYGTSEFLSLAFECRHGHLHLNSDWAILEPVDDQGHPVPPGEASSTTLLTNLANHLQPLIRYDLGDRVALHAQICECGSHLPVIEVQGRSDDMLQLRMPDSHMVRLLPLALSTVLEDDAGLFDFQLVQQGPCELLLRTGLRGAIANSSLRRAREVLSAFLIQQGAEGVTIHCRSGAPGCTGSSGKTKRVIAMPAESA